MKRKLDFEYTLFNIGGYICLSFQNCSSDIRLLGRRSAVSYLACTQIDITPTFRFRVLSQLCPEIVISKGITRCTLNCYIPGTTRSSDLRGIPFYIDPEVVSPQQVIHAIETTFEKMVLSLRSNATILRHRSPTAVYAYYDKDGVISSVCIRYGNTSLQIGKFCFSTNITLNKYRRLPVLGCDLGASYTFNEKNDKDWFHLSEGFIPISISTAEDFLK